MKTKYDIHKAAGIIIKDRKLLVERSKNKTFFISPGGSIEENETPKQALVRELYEEFQISVKEEDLSEFGIFCHPAAGQEERIVCMEVFRVNKWQGEIVPNNEVEEFAWVTSDNTDGLKIGSIIEKEVIPKLKQMDLID